MTPKQCQLELFNMSGQSQGLTEEQKRKIEESRKRALALKAEKLNKSSSGVTFHKSHPPSTSFKSTNGITNNRQANWAGNKNLSVQSSNNKAGSSSTSNFKSTPHYKNGYNTTQNFSQRQVLNVNASHTSSSSSKGRMVANKESLPTVNKDKFYGLPERVVRGKCVLISPDRFCVIVPYHGTLIEYFKEMETRSYDTASKSWSFLLKEYEKFYKGVKNFQPDVVIEPLPPIILQTFKSVKDTKEVKEVDLSSVDDVLVKTLMPFQKEGVNFAIHNGGRILLADEMGLGKTLQALCIACWYRSEWPLLIVTPSSVRFDWAEQIYKWLPSVDPQEVNVIDSGKGNVKEGLVCIISYDLISKKVERLKERRFKVIIMDESHFLKSSKAIRTKAAVAVTKLAKRVVLLSGTPALSRPSELFTQISICEPIYKLHDFGLRYCAGKQLPWGWDYSGSSNLEELQLLLEKKIMIRRQKSDVLLQLPAKTRQIIVLNPVLVSSNKSLNRAGKIMDKASLKGPDRRGALLQYFHETCKSKLRAVKDFVLDLIESDKKFLVFAHHKEMLDCLEDAIRENTKTKFIRIDGHTKSEQRSLLCRKFQTDDLFRVAILSITAANAGLNLSAANQVIFAELFWNPGILVQAEDRVHRIGQKNSVSIQYLVAKKTADDFIWPLVQDKLDILTKAGLSKDCFSNAATKHILDEKQSIILEMFKQDFIEDSTSNFEGENTTIVDCDEKVSTSSLVAPSQSDRKIHCASSSANQPTSSNKRSLPCSPDSAKKRQLQMTKFLKSSPRKTNLFSEVCANQNESKASSMLQHNPQQNQQILISEDMLPADTDERYNSILNDSFHKDGDTEVCDRQCVIVTDSSQTSSQTAQFTEEDCQALNDVGWDDNFWL